MFEYECHNLQVEVRAAWESYFSSTLWVLGMKLSLSGLAVSTLTSELSHPPVLGSSLHFVLTSVRIDVMQD